MNDYELKNLANKILSDTKLVYTGGNAFVDRINTAIFTLSKTANISLDKAREIYIEIKPELSKIL